MSEHDEQRAVCDYLRYQYPAVLFHAIPNGGWLHGNKGQRIGQVNKLKSEGMLPGCADLFIAAPRGGYAGFYLEMKAKDGEVKDNQVEFLNRAKDAGYFQRVAFGADEAIGYIDGYLSL